MFGSKLPVSRKHQRHRMRRAASLSLGDGSPPIHCVVWDLSEGGCRLAAPHATRLPVVFDLIMGPEPQDRRACHVMWQRGSYVGVKFVSAEEAERLADTLPDPRSHLYRNNDVAAFTPAKPKAAQTQNLRPRRRTYGL